MPCSVDITGEACTFLKKREEEWEEKGVRGALDVGTEWSGGRVNCAQSVFYERSIKKNIMSQFNTISIQQSSSSKF